MARPTVYEGSAAYAATARRPVLTIGNFDGVHLGHRMLLERVLERARALGAPACAYTFDPSPVEVLRPEMAAPRIQTLEDRIATLGDVGVDDVIVERFDRDFSQNDAKWFADEVICRRIGARGLVVGWDFRFGRGRGGGAQDLAQWLPIDVEQLSALVVGGEVVSSSRVRQLLLDGDVAGAAALLARPHRVTGPVVGGDRRGRTIGFPTANVGDPRGLLPKDGIYAVRVDWGDGPRMGAASLGTRPTFDGADRRLEVFVLDFAGDLYGRTLKTDFVARIRGEERFDSVDALVARMRKDVDEVRAVLAVAG